MPEVIQRFNPKRMWVYPHARHHKNFVSRLHQNCADENKKRILEELANTFKLIDELQKESRVDSVGDNSEPWPYEESQFVVRALAPGYNDIQKSEEWLSKVFEISATGRYEVTEYGQSVLENKKRGDHPNRLSIALSVLWKRRRMLLGGDVENGSPRKQTGWSGVLDRLERKQRLNIVQDLDIIKVSHHGSNNAFNSEAWKLHCPKTPGTPPTIALIAPNSAHELPHASTLREIRRNAAEMGVTSDAGGGITRASAEGWSASSRLVGPLDGMAGVLAVVLHADGTTELHAGSAGAFLKA